MLIYQAIVDGLGHEQHERAMKLLIMADVQIYIMNRGHLLVCCGRRHLSSIPISLQPHAECQQIDRDFTYVDIHSCASLLAFAMADVLAGCSLLLH